MRTSRVNANDKESYTIGSLSVVHGVVLSAVCERVDDSADGERARVDETGGEGELSHVSGKDTGIGSETGETDSHVVVDSEHLLLVAGEFGRGSFKGDEDSMCVAAEADDGGSLLYCFKCIFDLMKSTLW